MDLLVVNEPFEEEVDLLMFVGFVEENEEELLLVELVEFGFGGEEENAFDGGE